MPHPLVTFKNDDAKDEDDVSGEDDKEKGRKDMIDHPRERVADTLDAFLVSFQHRLCDSESNALSFIRTRKRRSRPCWTS